MSTREQFVDELDKYSSMLKAAGASAVRARHLKEALLNLFDNSVEFQVDDRVVLSSTIKVDEGSGWWTFRQDLKEGAAGVIVSIDLSTQGVFSYVWSPDVCTYHHNGLVLHGNTYQISLKASSLRLEANPDDSSEEETAAVAV